MFHMELQFFLMEQNIILLDLLILNTFGTNLKVYFLKFWHIYQKVQ